MRAKFRIILVLSLFGFSPYGQAQDLKEIAHSPYFKALLHYKKNFWGTEKSEADGAEFFLSPNGNQDLDTELEAELSAFQDINAKHVGPLSQHPQCAFPERFRFLKEQTGRKFTELACPEFQNWKQHFKPKSVTLIYAAPFLGSPSSMFGHSFLRIDSEEQALLDYGISFEATTGPDPGVLYAVKGLTGLYPGRFSQMPYYLKVNTYSNVDSRDLWEYQLNLSQQEISRMLNHIWEMGTTYFNYYFFNKNCSYHLLSLIEVAHPKFQLRSQFGPMAIPIDTLRAVTKYPGSINSVHYRPSLLKLLNARLKSLSRDHLERFYVLKDHHESLSNDENLNVLDALLDWQKYQSLKTQQQDSKFEQKLLIARAKILTPSQNPNIEDPIQPEQGHKTSKLTLGIGNEIGQSKTSFEFRPAIHALLDPDDGYIPFSTLLLAQTDFSYLNKDQKLRLDQFKFVEVTNLAPLTRLQKKFSWTIGARLFHPDDFHCSLCLGSQIFAGGGPSLSGWNDRILFYSFAKLYAEYANAFIDEVSQPFRAGPVLEFGVAISPFKNTKILVRFEKPWYFPSKENFYRNKFDASYSLKNFEFHFEVEQIFHPQEIETKSLVSLGYFY